MLLILLSHFIYNMCGFLKYIFVMILNEKTCPVISLSFKKLLIGHASRLYNIMSVTLQISVGLNEDSFMQPQRFLNTVPMCLMSPGNTGECSPRPHTLQPHITLPILFEYYHLSCLEGWVNVVRFIHLKAFLSVYT